MNICLVNNLFPPINTGSSQYTYDLALNLARSGNKITVITTTIVDNSFVRETDNSLFTIYRLSRLKLPQLSFWANFPDLYFTLFPKNFRRVIRILQEENIQIIHQCNNIFDLAFISSYASRKLKIPLVCSLTTQLQLPGKMGNLFLNIFDRLIIKYFIARHSHYVALDRETERYIYNRYKKVKSVHVIPYSVDRNEKKIISDLPSKIYTDTSYIMVSLGHISMMKDRRELIKAWKQVVEEIPQAKMLIVGELFDDKIRRLIRKLKLDGNIIFTGRISHEKIFDHIITSDFACMFLSETLAYHKGIGTANLECMACGLPTIADASNDFFGEEFPIKSWDQFISIENRDPKYLSDLFIKLFKDPELRRKIGSSGKSFIEETLTWEKIAEQIEMTYKTILLN